MEKQSKGVKGGCSAHARLRSCEGSGLLAMGHKSINSLIEFSYISDAVFAVDVLKSQYNATHAHTHTHVREKGVNGNEKS